MSEPFDFETVSPSATPFNLFDGVKSAEDAKRWENAVRIDPKSISDFTRTDSQLQAFWLFGLFVAGKNSDYASTCLARLLRNCKGKTPFEYLSSLGETGIHNALVVAKIGQYSRLARAVIESLNLDLQRASLERLMEVHGAGPKTCRFFLLHTRPDYQCAVLDTHILRWMRCHGVDTPLATPQNQKKYIELENTFLSLAQYNFPFLSIAQVDLLIWSEQSGRME